MSWLVGQLLDLFAWFWGGVKAAFEWLVASLVWVANRVCNNVTAWACGLLATLSGVMPRETLAGTWDAVLRSIDWLDGWPAYVLMNCLSFDEFLARASYLAGIVIAAYAGRAAFTALKALLELL